MAEVGQDVSAQHLPRAESKFGAKWRFVAQANETYSHPEGGVLLTVHRSFDPRLDDLQVQLLPTQTFLTWPVSVLPQGEFGLLRLEDSTPLPAAVRLQGAEVEVEWVPVDTLDQYSPGYTTTPRSPGASASPPSSNGGKVLRALGAVAAAGIAFGVKRWVQRRDASTRETEHASAERSSDNRVTDAAVGLGEQGMSSNPTNPSVSTRTPIAVRELYAHGKASLERGDFQQAELYFEEISKLYQRFPNEVSAAALEIAASLYHLAALAEAQGKRAVARERYAEFEKVSSAVNPATETNRLYNLKSAVERELSETGRLMTTLIEQAEKAGRKPDQRMINILEQEGKLKNVQWGRIGRA